MADPCSTQYGRRGTVDFLTANLIDRPPSPMAPRNKEIKRLVLCFDGTGNKFHGDESDSNILKIFRMLDRTADNQYHYYQRK